MPQYSAALDRDSNHLPIYGFLPFLTRLTRTYTGAAGAGAQGTNTIFTVTGDVIVDVVGTVVTDLAGASATISLGITGSVAGIIAATTATGLDAGMGWDDNSPALAETHAPTGVLIGNGLDITETVATADITGGVLNLYCFWRPMSLDGKVVAT